MKYSKSVIITSIIVTKKLLNVLLQQHAAGQCWAQCCAQLLTSGTPLEKPCWIHPQINYQYIEHFKGINKRLVIIVDWRTIIKLLCYIFWQFSHHVKSFTWLWDEKVIDVSIITLVKITIISIIQLQYIYYIYTSLWLQFFWSSENLPVPENCELWR